MIAIMCVGCGKKTVESQPFHGATVRFPEGFVLSDSGDLAAIEGKLGDTDRGPEMLRLEFGMAVTTDTTGWTKEMIGDKGMILHRDNVPGALDSDKTDQIEAYITTTEGIVACKGIVLSGLGMGGYLDICRTLRAK